MTRFEALMVTLAGVLAISLGAHFYTLTKADWWYLLVISAGAAVVTVGAVHGRPKGPRWLGMHRE